MDRERTVAVYVKREREDSHSETSEECRTRPCHRRDVKEVWDYLSLVPKRRVNLLDKVRIGYLMQTSSDTSNAALYCDAQHLQFVSTGEMKRWKLQLHVNFRQLKRQNSVRRGRRRPRVENEQDNRVENGDGSADDEVGEEVEGEQPEESISQWLRCLEPREEAAADEEGGLVSHETAMTQHGYVSRGCGPSQVERTQVAMTQQHTR